MPEFILSKLSGISSGQCCRTNLEDVMLVHMNRTDMYDSMEKSLHEVAELASALAAAIMGMDKIAIEQEHQQDALLQLADLVRFTAHKSVALWNEISRNPKG
jgi:hypothetical protein